jgi:hypothetical protein
MDTTFSWMKDKKVPVKELILKELLPLAKEGLKNAEGQTRRYFKYLDIIEARTTEHKTGARWALSTFTSLIKDRHQRRSRHGRYGCHH